MRVILRDDEVELVAETELDRQALVMLHRRGVTATADGATTDQRYPPDPAKTNLVLLMPDPSRW